MSIFTARFASVVTVLLAVAAARAAETQRQVWLISTRCAPHCFGVDSAGEALCYWRLNDECQWAPADAEQFHAGDELPMPTVVFIHGNRTDADDAVTDGWFVYETVCSQAGDKPFRYVIWSWPADRTYRRHRPDVQLKADLSDADSIYLAAWLGELRPGVKLSLIGHSFGPRIIAGALQLLASGDCPSIHVGEHVRENGTVHIGAGPKSENRSNKRPQIRAVLLASALDADSFSPCGCYGSALSLLDETLVTCNGCDRALRWYPRLYGRHGPEALGFTGPCGVADPQRVCVLDVSCTVGKTHNYRRYCTAANVCGCLAHYTFLDDAPAEK